MRSGIVIFLLLSFVTLITSCRDNEIISTNQNDLNNGTYSITFPEQDISTYPSPSGGQNISFICLATNNSNIVLDSVPVKVDLQYSPSSSQSYSTYTSGVATINHHGDTVASDLMSFANSCCNTCCPGFYRCIITAYQPENTTQTLTTSMLELKVDASGSFELL